MGKGNAVTRRTNAEGGKVKRHGEVKILYITQDIQGIHPQV